MANKIIPIILLIIILGVGFVAYYFYDQSGQLTSENAVLEEEKVNLGKDLRKLKDQNNKLRGTAEGLEGQLVDLSNQRTSLMRERQSMQVQINELKGQRDDLVAQLRAKPKVETKIVEVAKESVAPSDEYWADIVKTKAELEANLEKLNQELSDRDVKLGDIENKNKELSLKIDELTKERSRLERAIEFKERTLDIMSRDLVKERETRQNAEVDFKKVRKENVSLKRELVLVNKEKSRLEEEFKTIVETKTDLEKRVSSIDTMLKEKFMALGEIQDQLNYAIKGKVPQGAKSAPVELPPIVVKPETAGARGLRAEVISVNQEERFIVIDKGLAAGVRPGTVMDVVRADRTIGIIEVIEAREEISAADIKQELGGFSVREGDIAVIK